MGREEGCLSGKECLCFSCLLQFCGREKPHGQWFELLQDGRVFFGGNYSNVLSLYVQGLWILTGSCYSRYCV